MNRIADGRRGTKRTSRQTGPAKKRVATRPRAALRITNPEYVYKFVRTTAPLTMVATGAAGFLKQDGSVTYGFGIGAKFELSGAVFNATSSAPATVALPNYTEFVSLFDHWKIDNIEMCIRVGATNAPNLTVNNPFPTFLICYDSDNSTAPVSKEELCQRPETVFWTPGEKNTNVFKKKFTPRFALGTSQGGVFTGYSEALKGSYADCNYPGVDCFGIKIWADFMGQVNASQVCPMEIYFKYTLSFKGVQ